MKKVVIWVCLAVMLLGMSGCQNGPVYTGENTGTSCGNITMGQGKFAYSNGFIYFCSESKTVYEYDMESGVTVTLDLKDIGMPWGMFVSEDYIFLASGGIRYISKDGKKEGTPFAREDGCKQFFADGADGFYLNYVGESLFHRNMNTGEETELLSGVNGYYVDDSFIYAAVISEESYQLFRGSRTDFRFEAVELNVEPIAVNAGADGIFLSSKGSYQIVWYKDGTETQLPIYGTYYQNIGGSIIYSDSTEYKNGCFPVKKYDLQTGETTLLCENVFDFCVLEERYVCCQCRTGNETFYDLIDLQNGEPVRMYPPEEE